MSNSPAVIVYLFLAILLGINMFVFFIWPGSTALAFCLLVDYVVFMAVRPAKS